MFRFEIEKFVPQFILNDKNGYAIAMALQGAIDYMNNAINDGVNNVVDFDSMPEWRLDEIAWETNCLYDYNADIETRRKWIKNAIPLYRLYGTPQAVYQYISSYFENVELEENWTYNGEPYHFRIMVEGEWTPENESWARRAIKTAQNVRSVLDALSIGYKSFIGLTGEGEVLAKFYYPMTAADNWAGRWPQEAFKGILDDSAKTGIAADADAHKFPYPMTGTRPNPNTIGALDDTGRAGMEGSAEGYRYGYPMTSEGINAGTIPQENTIGISGENDIQAAHAEDTYAAIYYKLCGQDDI